MLSSPQQLAALLTEAFDFFKQAEHEFQTGFIHFASGAEMLDAAELAPSFGIKGGSGAGFAGNGTKHAAGCVINARQNRPTAIR